MNNKLIICSGDSFTAGHELAGDMLIPGYNSQFFHNTDPITPERTALANKLKEEEKKLIESADQTGYKQYWEESKRRAWPGKLKQFVKAEIVNCAAGGISNEEICWRASETYNQYVDLYDPEDILVIIMPTNVFRFGLPRYDKKMGNEYNWKSWTGHTNLDGDPKTRPIAEYFVGELTEYDHLWRSAMHLAGTQRYIKSMGSNLIFVDSCLWSITFRDYIKIASTGSNNIRKMVKIHATLVNTQKTSHAMHHFPEQTHEDFAKHLTETLSNIGFIG